MNTSSRIMMALIILMAVDLAKLYDSGELSIDEAYLFDKSQRMDRIVIKHQIAYHFQQKAVKEVTQELFISRLIDIGPLIEGLSLLNQTAHGLQQYCKLKRAKVTPGASPPSYQDGRYNPYWFITLGKFSYPVAKAKCEKLGKQLPEVYTDQDRQSLKEAVKGTNVTEFFAGIEYDASDKVYRFISSGQPYWEGLYRFGKADKTVPRKFVNSNGNSHFRFVHNIKEAMFKVYESKLDTPSYEPYTPDNYVLREMTVDGLVCQDKSYEMLPKRLTRRDASSDSSIDEDNYRSTATLNSSPVEGSPTFPDDQMDETCNALIAQMTDFHKDTYRKIDQLLALVDIDMAIKAQDSDEHDRRNKKKRFAAILSKIIFRKGTKLLWGLFGFWQQARMKKKIKQNTNRIQELDKRVNRTEHVNTRQQKEIDESRRKIDEATRLLKDQSITLTDLVVATKELDARVTEMGNHLKAINSEVDAIKDRLTVMTTVMLLSILTSRVTLAIDNGYEQLSEIIHTSLLGQTSPLVLPLAQVEEVQKKLGDLTITAVLDKDYSKMKSVVTADPNDSGFLLVIVNAVAVSHQKLELIKLIPIPFYDKTKGYYPILDYQYVALNQLANTFTVLTEEEAQSCIESRCYVSQMEQNLHSQSCGMPQFQDHALEACDMEGIPHDGLFVQAANPDGVVFSFRDEVKTQLFCKSNDQIMAKHKMAGAGVMFVPPGCVLNAIDKQGKVVKVKGGPSHHLIEISKLDLTEDPLLMAIPNAETSIEEGGRKSSAEKAIEHQLLIVQESMDAAHKHVDQLQKKIWITIGCFAAIIVIIVIGIAILYRYSKRFQRKFKKVIGGFAALRDRFEEMDIVKRDVASLSTAVVPFRPNRISDQQRSRIRADDVETREYIHLDNQVRVNQKSPAEVRHYDKLPLTRPRKVTSPPSVALRQLKLPRLYPTCPEQKEEGDDDDEVSSCKSLDRLSLIARFGADLRAIESKPEVQAKPNNHE